MDELDSKLRNLEELEAARAKEAWEKHVVSTPFWYSTALCSKTWKDDCAILRGRYINWFPHLFLALFFPFSEHCA